MQIQNMCTCVNLPGGKQATHVKRKMSKFGLISYSITGKAILIALKLVNIHKKSLRKKIRFFAQTLTGKCERK